jgi:AcrR family transcriptional regulator
MSSPADFTLPLTVRRPQRADARRNFDALIAAARDVFAENGTDASLEDIARRANVGIGTLYRNFPTRQDLFTSVYVGGVEELCMQAREFADLPPMDGFSAWLEQFTTYVATKMAMKEALKKISGNTSLGPCAAGSVQLVTKYRSCEPAGLSTIGAVIVV